MREILEKWSFINEYPKLLQLLLNLITNIEGDSTYERALCLFGSGGLNTRASASQF